MGLIFKTTEVAKS